MRKRIKNQKLPDIQVFDPMKGEDYRVPLGKRGDVLFSSREHNSVVISMNWMRGWRVHPVPVRLVEPAIVSAVLKATASLGFLSVFPGGGIGDPKSLGELRIQRYGEALFSHFPHDERTVRAFLQEADRRGTHEEWLIGSVAEEVDPDDVRQINPHSESPDLIYFLTRFSSTGAVWAFNFDIGELVVVFRTFEGYEDVVSRIVQDMAQSSR
ncbi:MAG: hypothetical protein JSW71_06745 [Gemmatimonadota bacterium]|nr:MAG: hypothetical protein JSW71_06745 [Gemmatimonadota bacterium]